MISEHAKVNFETLKRAIANDDAALMQCIDTVTGESCTIICACNRGEPGSNEEFQFVPLAMALGNYNPYERFQPPMDEEESA